jgi:hypothetical protein
VPVLREALIESQGGKNTDTGPLADIFVIGAFIGVPEPAGSAANAGLMINAITMAARDKFISGLSESTPQNWHLG